MQMTQMISIFDDAVYGDVFYNGNGDKYYYVKKSDTNGDDNPFPYHLVMDKDFDWNKKPDEYISVCCYCANGAICWSVIDHWDEKDELYKTSMIIKKGEREEPTTESFHLFDNIRFGDKFRTRSGDLAIFTYYSEVECRHKINKMWAFITESYTSGYHCGTHGRVVDYNRSLGSYTERTEDSDLDIVDKWDG